jgi:uncharacterized membrane protein YgcG
MRVARIVAVLALAVAPVLVTATPAAAGPEDFTISSFTADYYLDRDSGGRSTLRTVETIVAQFPDFDQNHGILRHLVDDYQGHPTNIDVESVTDEQGNSLSYDTETDDLFYSLRIGDADEYVRGSHTYVITYTQHNVTLFDDDVEEFYWDTNGTGWPQRFDSLTARFHISSQLARSLTGDVACYRGVQGADEHCEATALDGSEVVYEVTEHDLGPYQNVSIAIGFEPGTFVPRDNSATATPVFFVELAAALGAVIVGIVTLGRRRTLFADAPGRPTIVAEYLPPKNASVLESAFVIKRKKKAVAAQLISLAVAKKIRIIESPAQGFFASGNQYTLELVDATGLSDDETALARAFFGSSLDVGETYTIVKSDTTVGKAVYAVVYGIQKALTSRGWHKTISAGKRVGPAFLAIAATAITFFTFILMVDDERGGWIPLFVLLPAILSAIITIAVVSRSPLTEKGAELRDHLEGLHLYIRVAEKDRIRVLQSPEGAERTPVDTTDRGQMLTLYERVLPFAVVFDEEKRWAKELGEYYDEQPPEWYSGSGAFSTAAFASGISSVATSAASAYSASSSSSGGSSGGGSSGGGGGGGGGGGW